MAVGDVIVAAGGRNVDSAATLTEILAELEPGAEVELELIDTVGPRLVTVTLVRRGAGTGP
jgi:S1-C subfamily serine protease